MIVKVKQGATRHMFDALDTHGGHIIVCLFLMFLGAAFTQMGLMDGDHIIEFALGVLARSMYGSTDRSAQRDAATPPALDTPQP